VPGVVFFMVSNFFGGKFRGPTFFLKIWVGQTKFGLRVKHFLMKNASKSLKTVQNYTMK